MDEEMSPKASLFYLVHLVLNVGDWVDLTAVSKPVLNFVDLCHF